MYSSTETLNSEQTCSYILWGFETENCGNQGSGSPHLG